MGNGAVMIVQQTMTVVCLFRISLRSPNLGGKAKAMILHKFLHYYMNELSFIIQKLEHFIRLDKKHIKMLFTSVYWNLNVFKLFIRYMILLGYPKPKSLTEVLNPQFLALKLRFQPNSFNIFRNVKLKGVSNMMIYFQYFF